MKRDINRTRSEILSATARLMTSAADPSEVTSRCIAAEAQVNLAMINYCFGSREALLAEVFSGIMQKAMQSDSHLGELLKSDIPPKEKLIEVHIIIMRLMLDNMNYSRAITKYILLERDMIHGMESLPLVMAHFSGSRTEEECRMITFSLTSSNELAVLKSEELKKHCGIDLADSDVLRKFVTDNVNRYLP